MDPINIRIKVDERHLKSLENSFSKETQKLVNEILDALEFPCQAQVEVQGFSTENPVGQLWVEDRLCAVYSITNSSVDQNAFVESIYSTLSTDPSIYLTSAVASHFWNKLAESDKPCPENAFNLLEQTLKYRLKPWRLPPLSANLSEDDFRKNFEYAFSSVSRRIEIQLNTKRYQELGNLMLKENENEEQGNMIQMMVDGLFYELGIVIGECVPTPIEELAYDQFRLRINDTHSSAMRLFSDDKVLVNDTVDRLRLLNINGQEAINPANGSECAIIDAADSDVATQSGLTIWGPAGFTILYASVIIRQSANVLLTLEMMDVMLEKLTRAFPALTSRVKELIGVPKLARILRYLLAEELSIRNLRLILECLLLIPAKTEIDEHKYIIFTPNNGFRPELSSIGAMSNGKDIQLAETLRMFLRRYISHKYTRGGNTLVVYLLEPAIEDRLTLPKPWTTDEYTTLMTAINREVGNLPPSSQNPVILTSANIRYHLRSMIEREFPHLAVLSYNELSPDMNIQPIARISTKGFDDFVV